jgi:adenylate cyclase
MNCPDCGHDNPSESRFCNSCGASLASGGAETGDGAARTGAPEHLAEKIRSGRSAIEGERKQVTVLFADVQGSMELAESTDAEALREIMDRFFAILADGVHKFEGTVDKFTGDGIMAIFGAPIAHEDHAQRACYAALHLREELAEYSNELRRTQGVNFSVRMGINSGEVVVGSIGDDLTLSYTAIGQTVGLAQRMEQLAQPGSAYVTEHTASLVEGFFELSDLGEFEVKGVSKPLGVQELLGTGAARSRLDVSQARGFSLFVGRGDEMARLEEALEKTRAGDGQVIGIVGEPGVGKSRLCHEITERCRARGIPVYQAAGLAHARDVPLLPVLRMMRSYFDISDADSDQAAREKVAGRLLLLDPELNEELPLVFEFLGVPDPERPAPGVDPESRKQRLLGMVRRLVDVQSEREPGVNLLEDLHWIDPSSNEFLAGLVAAVAGSRTLTIVNFRPEYEAEWMDAEHYSQIDLEPLGGEAVAELLADLLGTDPSLDGLAELVTQRTGGNPFFVEEVVQELVEAGSLSGQRGGYKLTGTIGEVSVPATVQSVLEARMDRLAEVEKASLQAAAVVGREFSKPVISRVAGLEGEELDRVLASLVAGEFIYEQELYPELICAFKHPLTQEVAYGSMLAERRCKLHAAAAEAIAETQPERADERAALIAGHWEQAGEALQAVRWHARAANWTGYKDPVPALGHWQRVRELLTELPEDDETAALEMASRLWTMQFGWRLGITDEEATEHFELGNAIAERRDDTVMRAMFHSIYSTTSCIKGRVELAEEHAIEGIRIADESGDPTVRIAMRTGGAYVLFIRGRLEESLKQTEIGIEIGRQDPSLGRGLGVTSPYAFCVMFRGGVLSNLGRLDEAQAALEEAMVVAEREGDPEAAAWNYSNRVHVAWSRGDPALALAAGMRGIEVADRIGDVFTRAWARTWLGTAHILAGEHQRGIDELQQALDTTRAHGIALDSEPWRVAWLGEGLRLTGDSAQAVELSDRALEMAQSRGAKGPEGAVQWMRAKALLSLHGADAAEQISAALDESQRIADEIPNPIVTGWNYLERGELARLQGDPVAREAALRQAREVFERHRAHGWLRQTDELLATPA